MTKSNKNTKNNHKAGGEYPKKSTFFIKRWWDNYLVRLNKITHGKAQCCD